MNTETTNTVIGADTLVNLTANIVSAYVGSQSAIAASDIPSLIQSVHSSLRDLGAPVVEEAKQEPAVAVRNSIKPDYIVCLEDGKKLKMLKRYLRTNFNMTPDEYRAKWGLNADYPMVAPNYAEKRRDLAKKIGLGTKREDGTTARSRRKAATAAPVESTPAKKTRGRPTNASKKIATEAAAAA